jgi:alpha-L-fucosidase
MAVKEVFFTSKGNNVYAILPKLPDGKLLLRDVVAQPKTQVSLLGTNKTFPWRQVDGGLEVTVPPLLAKEVPCEHAWTLKLTDVR